MIVFYLMSEKGYSVLKTLPHHFPLSVITAVVSSKDRNVKNDFYEEIKLFCSEFKIPFFDRLSEEVPDSRYAIAVSWRWLLQKHEKLVVLHDSILPKYKGFAPLVSALINGETSIGVTALFASEQYDDGDIIAQKAIGITYPIKINNAIQAVSIIYADIVCEVVTGLLNNHLPSVPQKKEDSTYSLWLDEDDYRIKWDDSSTKIIRFINAVSYPYKGASSIIGDKKVRILDAIAVPDVVIENRCSGKVIFVSEGEPVVVCGNGLVRIKEMRWETGENALPLKNFRTRFL